MLELITTRRMQTNYLLWDEHPMDAETVIKIINQIYSDKTVEDKAADAVQAKRVPFPDFVYAWHVKMCGVGKLADEQVHALCASLRHYRGTEDYTTRMSMFEAVAELKPFSFDDDDVHDSPYDADPLSNSKGGALMRVISARSGLSMSKEEVKRRSKETAWGVWQLIQEHHYLLRIFFAPRVGMTASSTVALFFFALFSKVLVLSILWELSGAGMEAQRIAEGKEESPWWYTFAVRTLMSCGTLLLSSFMHRPTYMMHRKVANMQRKQAISDMTGSLRRPIVRVIGQVGWQKGLMERYRRVVVSQLLLWHLATIERRYRRKKQVSWTAAIFVQRALRKVEKKELKHQRSLHALRLEEHAELYSKRGVGWLMWILTWLWTFAFCCGAVVMAYFFITDTNVPQEELDDWFRSLTTTFAIWLFGTHPAGIILKKYTLPVALRRSTSKIYSTRNLRRKGGGRRRDDEPIVSMLPSTKDIQVELAAQLIRGQTPRVLRHGKLLTRVAQELQLLAIDDCIDDDRRRPVTPKSSAGGGGGGISSSSSSSVAASVGPAFRDDDDIDL